MIADDIISYNIVNSSSGMGSGLNVSKSKPKLYDNESFAKGASFLDLQFFS